MAHGSGEQIIDLASREVVREAAQVQTVEELAGVLRALRRRHARGCRDGELTYREMAHRTGWSQTAIAEYFTGKTLPPTDRFDAMIDLLGAAPAEQGVLASARDRVEERRRWSRRSARGDWASGAVTPPDGVPDGQLHQAHGADRVIPRQLPTAVRQFVGRSAELAALTEALRQTPAAGTVMVSVICGTAGVGKTALAVYWAHQVAAQFPDGQLYVNLRGFDPGGPMTPAEAIRGFLDALDVPPQRIPASLDAQAALYRSLLSGRRMLLLLDNASDISQVRPLLPGTPTCLALVTSRNQLTGLVAAEGARPVPLDLLAATEARELLAEHLTPGRVGAEPEAIESIIALCARLPLALALVAAHAVTHPHLSLPALAAELRDTQGRLDAFAGDDPTTDVRAVFSWSHRALRPAAARLFRLLGLHPGPDISASAAASLIGLPVLPARRLLTELTRAHLIVERTPGRYTFHDLLRAYAAEQARAIEPAPQRREAIRRILDHYLHTARTAARLLNPLRKMIEVSPPAPGVTPVEFAGYGEALTWFTDEHAVLLAAVDQAETAGMDVHTWQLAWALVNYLERRGHWHEYAATQRSALAATKRLADPFAEAQASRLLALACTCLTEYDEARTYQRHALELYRKIGDRTGEAYTHYYLAVVAERQSRHTEGLSHARQALELHQAAGERVGRADALNAIGWFLALLGEHEEALAHCEQALVLHREAGHVSGEADTWDSLGYAYHHLGRHREAIDCYREALQLLRDPGDRYYEADTLTHLGDVHLSAGDPDTAMELWHQARDIFDDLGHSDAAGVRARLERLAAERGNVV
jgi:tetratricopeptide (TPR) repeat protein